MKRNISLLIIILIVLSFTGCTLPADQSTGQVDSIVVLEPPDGAQYPEDALVVFRSEISAAQDVDLVELWVNGERVRSDRLSLPLSSGTVLQSWKPELPGEYTVQVQVPGLNDSGLSSQAVHIIIGDSSAKADENVGTGTPVTLAAPATLTPTVTITPTITPTKTQTQTPTLGPPMVTANDAANCRFGPGLVYDVISALGEGSSALITGRNVDTSWWVIERQDGYGQCWISDNVVTVSGDTRFVPIITAPPTPTWTPTAVVLRAPNPLSPSGTIACLDVTGGITLSWSATQPVSGISNYEWVLDGGGSTRSGTETGMSAYIHSMGCFHTYTWKVRAVYDDGTIGPYSSEMTFKVE